MVLAMFFFPQHEIKRAQAKKMFEIIVEKEGLEFLGWREVPVVPEVLGHKALENACHTLCRHLSKSRMIWKKALHLTVNCILHAVSLNRVMTTLTYVSMCSRTIVYKGMFLVGQLRTFFSGSSEPGL